MCYETIEKLACIYLHRYVSVIGSIYKNEIASKYLLACIVAIKYLFDTARVNYSLIAKITDTEKKTLISHEMNFLHAIEFRLYVFDGNREFNNLCRNIKNKHHISNIWYKMKKKISNRLR